jgi:flagellar biosynthesis/type III secretory pathway protein FliH
MKKLDIVYTADRPGSGTVRVSSVLGMPVELRMSALQLKNLEDLVSKVYDKGLERGEEIGAEEGYRLGYDEGVRNAQRLSVKLT